MHACLRIPEILGEICKELNMNPQKFGGQDSRIWRRGVLVQLDVLLDFALSCRHIMETAMDERWHTLKSIELLLKVFPERIRSRVFLTDHRNFFTKYITVLDCAPSPSEWERYFYYARRVKRITLSYSGPSSVSTTLRYLCEGLPPGELYPIPGLLQVTLPWDSLMFSKSSYLLPPTLSSVEITLPGARENNADYDTDTSFFQLLETIQQCCPALTTIKMTVNASLTPYHLGIFRSLSDTGFLREASVITWPKSVDYIHELATFPCLSSLCINGYRNESSLLPPKAFPSLTCFDANFQTAEEAVQFIRSITSSSLKSCRCRIPSGPTTAEDVWGPVADSLRKFSSSLQSVQLIAEENNLDEDDDPQPSLLTWKPLLSISEFNQLRELVLSSDTLQFSDTFLISVAQGCPDLAILELEDLDEDLCGFSGLTCRGLISLRRCPQLHTLQLCLEDTDPHPALAELRQDGRRNFSLENIAIGHTSIEAEDPIAVGLLLYEAFPNLQTIQSRGYDDEQEGWRNVEDAIRAMRIRDLYHRGGTY